MLWNPFTGKALGQLAGHGASVLELRMNENDHQLISLAADKVVKVWDIRTYKCLQVRRLSRPRSVGFFPTLFSALLLTAFYQSQIPVSCFASRKLNVGLETWL